MVLFVYKDVSNGIIGADDHCSLCSKQCETHNIPIFPVEFSKGQMWTVTVNFVEYTKEWQDRPWTGWQSPVSKNLEEIETPETLDGIEKIENLEEIETTWTLDGIEEIESI